MCIRDRGVAGAHHIQQIPTRVAVLPAVGVGIVEVAIEDIAAHFVIEADVVVTENAGAGHAEGLMDLAGELGFINAFGARHLRRDAGDHHRLRFRQVVVGRGAVDDQRLFDNVEIHIGAHAGELRRAVQRRALAEGLVIVNVEGVLSIVVFHCLGLSASVV